MVGWEYIAKSVREKESPWDTSKGLELVLIVTEPPRLYPRTGDPPLFAALPFHVEKFGLVDDDLVHPHVLDLLLLYPYQLVYLGSLPTYL
jgi:hypothetical protein